MDDVDSRRTPKKDLNKKNHADAQHFKKKELFARQRPRERARRPAARGAKALPQAGRPAARLRRRGRGNARWLTGERQPVCASK